METPTNVLIVGAGGREHALAWKLSQSPFAKRVFTAPANATEFSCDEIADLSDVNVVIEFVKRHAVGLVVLGPEKPICDGWTEALARVTSVFAPSQKASQLEASKSFAKAFMTRHNIPTATFRSFCDRAEAQTYIESLPEGPLVLKEDGLCAGKGVFVLDSRTEALHRLAQLPVSVQNPIVVEEFLEGFEVSALCFTDGNAVRRMPFSQDHKRAFDGDRGENTGGMGAVAPVFLSARIEQQVDAILRTAVDGMRSEGAEYKGVLYAGIMVTASGPKVLEFNCRFGDPETEVLLRLLASDLFPICIACCDGTLAKIDIEWSNKCAIGVVVAAKGYPGSFQKGLPIELLPDPQAVVTFLAGVKKTPAGLESSGGRILCITATAKSFFDAKLAALASVERCAPTGTFWRRDIGRFVMEKREPMSYASAGVNIAEGNALVDSIKSACKRTLTPGTDEIGGFGALVDLKAAGFTDPQLVLGMDGVGTKIEIASQFGDFSGLGFDLVGMCVNDVLCHGAAPLAFLDYYVTGKLDQRQAAQVVCSIAKACEECGCALVGGETAEMPGVYGPEQWDLAGCCIGVRERRWLRLPQPDSIEEGDVLIGVPSNGLHSNGFSLVRRILSSNEIDLTTRAPWAEDEATIGAELLKPTKLYTNTFLPLLKSPQQLIKALAHITGGGLVENVPRVLPSQLNAEIDCAVIQMPAVFSWLQRMGAVPSREMFRTFNCGIGMVAVVSREHSEQVIKAVPESYIIGKVVKRKEGEGGSRLRNQREAFNFDERKLEHRTRANIAVLISGTGSNMINLINQASNPLSRCFIRLVISNRPDAKGLEAARERGIEAICIEHGTNRKEFEAKIHAELVKREIDFICLAGFMRILTGGFTELWANRIINIHPSLLPSFKGGKAVQDALAAGAKVTGCTAHFVCEEVDAGKILAQEAVTVSPQDTEESLHLKIQQKEHSIFPQVMEMVAEMILDGK